MLNLSETENNGFVVHEHEYELMANNLDYLQILCHESSKAAGWHTNLETGLPVERNVAECLCLIHSEISEALEGHRKNQMDDKLPHRPMIEVELADAMIRILDLGGALNLDLGGAFAEKFHYNQTRKDHKVENRRLADGKKF